MDVGTRMNGDPSDGEIRELFRLLDVAIDSVGK